MQLFKNGGSKYPKEVYVWRGQVQAAVAALEQPTFTGPVELHLGFELPRPATHFLPVNSKRAMPELRSDAPTWPGAMPDIDKLIRAICDSITDAGLWGDDGQVVVIVAAKRYTSGTPGVTITVKELL
jgi:Holliday junction resolvase RusA-like endonuclease